MSFKGIGDGKAAYPTKQAEGHDALYDDIYVKLKTTAGIEKIQPEKKVLSEKDKAQQRREKLEKMQKSQSGIAEDDDDDEIAPLADKKREAKL